MHGRATCELYNLAAEVPGSCTKHATKKMRIFNSGVMLMSAAHRRLLAGWETSKLECRILCAPPHLTPLAAPCSPLPPLAAPLSLAPPVTALATPAPVTPAECPSQPLTASYHPYTDVTSSTSTR